MNWSPDTIRGDLSNWSDDYEFALANELTGDRPWAGTYDLVAVYDQALDASEVSQNYRAGSGSSTVVPSSLAETPFSSSVNSATANLFTQENSRPL